jgi:ABC-type phosphate transport system substrate-binding protein
MYRAEKGKDLREVLRFLVDDEGTEAVEKSGLVPLPEMTRERLALDFERL